VALGVSVEYCAGTKEISWQFLRRQHVDLTDLTETFFSVTCVTASVKYWTWWCIVTDNKWCTFTAVWHQHELVWYCYLPLPCKYSLGEGGLAQPCGEPDTERKVIGCRSIQPPVQWIPGLFPRGKTAGCGTDRPPPPLAPRLKKRRAIPLLSFWDFIACSFIKFYFLLFVFLEALTQWPTNFLQFCVLATSCL
jgi:hypothetical protein